MQSRIDYKTNNSPLSPDHLFHHSPERKIQQENMKQIVKQTPKDRRIFVYERH